MPNGINESQRAVWKQWVEEQRNSELTQSEFCRKHNLSKAKFGYYKKIFSLLKSKEKARLLPVNLNKIEISEEIHVTLPNGFQCDFPLSTDPLRLREWIKVLLSC